MEQFSLEKVSEQVDKLVDEYLVSRSKGTPSIVGSHLNYANPGHSTTNNLGWIAKLDGPSFGDPPRRHIHGTDGWLQKSRPEPFRIILPRKKN